MIAVDFLSNHREHAKTVSLWIHEEWGRMSGRDRTTEVARTRARLNDDRIPLCLVAMDGGVCVGTISIYTSDLSSRPDLAPWLAALYVAPDRRNRGIGGALIRRLLEVARGLGIRKLYLHTETAAEYYRRKGWHFLFNTVNDRGEDSMVFDLNLAP